MVLVASTFNLLNFARILLLVSTERGQGKNQLFRRARFCNPLLPSHLINSDTPNLWPDENDHELADAHVG